MGIQNTKFKVINQHKNDMCHVQSLKKEFYLGAFGSFDYVFISSFKKQPNLTLKLLMKKLIQEKTLIKSL
jgi:hypothetical protein